MGYSSDGKVCGFFAIIIGMEKVGIVEKMFILGVLGEDRKAVSLGMC